MSSWQNHSNDERIAMIQSVALEHNPSLTGKIIFHKFLGYFV